MVGWAWSFVWRAVFRLLAQFYSVLRTALQSGNEIFDFLKQSMANAKPLFASFLGSAAVVLVILRLLVVAVLISCFLVVVPLTVAGASLVLVVLVLLSVIGAIPTLGKAIRPIVIGFAAIVGDATAWTRHPLRAAAMRDVVRGVVRSAGTQAKTVIVVSHSQGAAVSVAAILGPGGARADVLVTIGGAVSLLANPRFAERSAAEDWSPISDWQKHDGLRWVNVWSMWDPVPAGPIGTERTAARQRWTRSIVIGRRHRWLRMQDQLTKQVHNPSRRWLGKWPAWMSSAVLNAMPRGVDEPLPPDATVGPEEWPVHNMSSVFRDHTTYDRNIVQVIERLARLSLDPTMEITDDPNTTPVETPGSRRERQYIRSVRFLGWYRILCLPATAVLTGGVLQLFGVEIQALSALADSAEGSIGTAWQWITAHHMRNAVVAGAAGIVVYAALSLTGEYLWRLAGRHIDGRGSAVQMIPFALALLAASIVSCAWLTEIAAARMGLDVPSTWSVRVWLVVAGIYLALIPPLAGPLPAALAANRG